MMNITIFGTGNMGSAIGKNFETKNNSVTYYNSSDVVNEIGEIVILAVPYAALSELATKYSSQLENRTVIDITNPVNFETWDSLVVPVGSSATHELQQLLPKSNVLKAFNTNFAATLASGMVGESDKTTVLVAGNSEEAKKQLSDALVDSPLDVIDAGSLERAKELEATGFLQMTLAAREKINWTGGFAVKK